METGLLLLTYRYLDPATGRFLTMDPIGVEGGVNLYAYVGNGVVVNADPAGLILWIVPIPRPSPLPPGHPCIRNPRPGDLSPGCVRFGKKIICKPEDCFRNWRPHLGPWMKERCHDCCDSARYAWDRHKLRKCHNLCESDPIHVPPRFP